VSENPFAPPKADLEGGPVERLSPEMEARAMEMLGKLRARTGAISFAVIWPLCTAVLMLGLGLIWALIVGSVIGAALSRAYVKARRRAMVESVCRALGVRPGSFNPDQYLID
jgi:hypothetical protein